MAKKRKLAVFDFETDPFKYKRMPIPFAWGFYDGDNYHEHWEPYAWEPMRDGSYKAAKAAVRFFESLEDDCLIYAHNGGKFDFMFFMGDMRGSLRIVNGRILECRIADQLFRDSYAILPIPLSALGEKSEIDYKLMEREVREHHKAEILAYQKQDCIALYNAVSAFRDEFGDQLTIGGTAMKALKSFHDFDSGHESFDKQYRKYYFGGRCQCFETGVIDMPVKGFDLNSSYPFTMKTMRHPVSTEASSGTRVTKRTAFVTWEGENFNAVPTRTKTGLDFTVPRGTFHSTIHEFEAGLDTGTINPERILETQDFRLLLPFDDFVDFYYNSRLRAALKDDVFRVIFYKLILNAAYGKFAQDPENFEDSIILPFGDIPSEEWGKAPAYTHGQYAIWCRPATRKTYLNVATAASITGGSRATLLRGLASAKRPVYCDTDSIYCLDMAGNIDSKTLGAWKHEFTGEQIAIAGKKLYAVMGRRDGDPAKFAKEQKRSSVPLDPAEIVCLKKASKGTVLHPLAIFMIARGDTCETFNDPPSFKLDGKHQFVHRAIRRTS